MTTQQQALREYRSLEGGVVAFCGIRGIPANYGGFETVVEEISKRFSEEQFTTEVFCRKTSFEEYPETVNGCQLVWVNGSKSRKLDTFVSSIQTGLYLRRNKQKYKYVFWYNNANLPGILITYLARIPMAVNTNGLEWRRAKWSLPFKAYYYFATRLIARLCKTLISDSNCIKNFYKERFGAISHFIPYGVTKAPIVETDRALKLLSDYGLEDGRYFIQITRIEPDNLPLDIVRAFRETKLSKAGYKMVIVGFSSQHPYSMQLKEHDGLDGVVIMNTIYDQEVLAVLRRYAIGYIHGNSVGGTNPALLEAMQSCRRVMAINVPFSHEVLAETGHYFDLETLGSVFHDLIDSNEQAHEMQERVNRYYQWDEVSDSYLRLAQGQSACYSPALGSESKSKLCEP